MNTDQVINLLATVALIELMLTIGLEAAVSDIVAVATDSRAVLGAMLANYVAVPAVTVALVLLLRASPMVAAGFLVVAVCPGAPYGPPFTAIARGNVARAVGLMVILAGSSAVLAPLQLKLLLRHVAGDTPVAVHAARIVTTLALVQFLPLCLGLLIRARQEPLANRLAKPLRQLSTVLNVALLGLILIVQFHMLKEIRLAGYAGMLALLAASILAGWIFGGPGRTNRDTLAITTAVRNVGVALVIAGGSFPGTPAVTATTAYALFQTIAMALLVLTYRRWARCTAPASIAAASPVA
jgi:BASS family bile acid:Na+ symporter